MEILLWSVLALAIVSALAAGLALGLHLLKPAMAERRRILWSAGLAGFLPGSIGFLGFLSEARPGDDDFAISLLALIVLQLVILAVFALPPAWFTTTRLAKNTDDSSTKIASGGETQLIA